MNTNPTKTNLPIDAVAVKVLPKDKVLDKLGEDFIETRDKKAKLAEKITLIEKNILERMTEKGWERYRFSDQELVVKPGNTHVKVKTVTVGSTNGDEAEGEDDP